ISIFSDTSGKNIDDFPQITTTSSSDDRFLNIKMATAFSGEVGLRIQNELSVDKTTLTYDGNNDETYLNTFGSGGMIATIGAGDCVFQMSSTSANFKINATASPDTSDVFSIIAGGANGGSSNFLVGSRNPEGNANKAFGHFYVRTDGVNTGLYAKKSAGVSTIDWYPFPTAPQSTVTNALTTCANTSGTSLLSVDTAQVLANATSTTMLLDTVTSAGIAAIDFRNAASASRLIIEYSETADRSILSDISANGFRMSATSGVFAFETSASDLTLNANVPTAAGAAGFVINDFSDTSRLSVNYDDNTDVCTVDLNSDVLLTTTSSESALTILSPSVTGTAK
ncbi:MAG: hypothetical protein GY954_19155, partial [Alteromonas sp.]|nr:hypothetical protein [Alteromonas sp.]